MRKHTFHKLLLLMVGLTSLGLFLFAPKTASAANPTTINFQGKIVNANGTNVTNGTYSFVFRIYNTASPTMTTSCTSTATCLWEETQSSVTVTNGVFQVELGASCALTSGSCNNSAGGPINFKSTTSLYLTLQYAGDTSGANGGFMSPTIHLTSVSFALNADNATHVDAGTVTTLGIGDANATAITLGNVANSTFLFQAKSSSTAYQFQNASNKNLLSIDTSGSQVLLGTAGSSGLNGQIVFNTTNASNTSITIAAASTGTSYSLTLPTTGPSTSQCLQTDSVTASQLKFAACAAGGGSTLSASYALGTGTGDQLLSLDTTKGGGLVLRDNATTVTNALQIQNSSSTNLLSADTANMRIGVDITYAAMGVPSGLTSTASAGTGFTAGDAYRYEVTALDSAGGETTVSNEPTACSPASTNLQCTLAWTAVTKASAYRVYRTANAGGTGTEKYLTTVVTNSYIDTNSITLSALTAPTTNTAITSTNNSSSLLQLSVGGVGTPTGQAYIGGITPKEATDGGVATSGTSGNNTGMVSIQGRYAYVVNNSTSKLQVFDINTPSAPTDLTSGGVTLVGAPVGISVKGSYAYILAGTKLQVFDISKPTSPTDISGGGVSSGVSGSAGIDIQGQYAYISGGSLNAFDISNPAKPRSVDSISLTSNCNDVYVQGSYAYCAISNGAAGNLDIIDISDPANLTSVILGYSLPLSGPRSITVVGRYAYIPAASSKLLVIDVSNPAAPVDVSGGGATLSALGWDSTVQGRYIYVGTTSGISVSDITNPTKPVQMFITANTGAPQSLYVQGRYLYGYGTKLVVYDLGGLYSQSLEAGGALIGSLDVALNAQVAGALSVGGGLFVGQGLGVSGDLGVGGNIMFQNTTNSTTAFQVQNATAQTVMVVDTTNSKVSVTGAGGLTVQPSADSTNGFNVADKYGTSIIKVNTTTSGNLLSNGSFEGGTTNGWAAINGATISSSSSQFYVGANSLSVATSATTLSGASYTYPFKPNTTYTLSFRAFSSTLLSSIFKYGITSSGATGCTNQTTTLAANAWTQFTCTATTASTVSQTDSFFINKSGATTPTFFLDAVQLEIGSAATTYADPGFSLTSIIPYGNFENANANGWAVHGTGTGATVSASSDYAKYGSYSLKLVTGTVANNGAEERVTLKPSTQYALSFWGRLDTGTSGVSEFNAGWNENPASLGTATGDQNCTTTPDISTAGNLTTTWAQFTCTFTTGTTIGASSNVFIKQTDTVTNNVYIDGISLVQASSALSFAPVANGLDYNNYTSNLVLNGYGSGELQPWRLNNTPLGANSSTDTTNRIIAREGASTITANGYVYVVGGYDGTNTLNSIAYAKMNSDGSLGNWFCQGTNVATSCGTSWTAASGQQNSTNSLPAARRLLTSVIANGYIYAIGGYDGAAAASTIYYSKLNGDGSTGIWQTNAVAMPAARLGSSAVVVNGILYILGGCTDTTCTTNAVNTIYYGKLNANGSISGVTTSSVLNTNSNNLTNNRGLGSVVYANGYIYYVGGNGSTPSTGANSTVYYAAVNADASLAAFATNTALPAARDEQASIVANGYLYIIGGCSALTGISCSSGAATSTIYYSTLNGDATLGNWNTAANPLPANRGASTITFANSYIYVMGGFDGTNRQSTVYYASTPRTLIAGGLDLLGLNSQSLDSYGGGGALTAGNTRVVGTLTVDGYADFNNGISVDSALSINAVTGTLGQSIFNINNSSSNSIFSIQHMGTNFGSLATAGAFMSKNSYWGQEYNIGNAGALNMTGSATPFACSWGRGDSGGHINGATAACGAAANASSGQGDMTLSASLQSATTDACTPSQPVGANGVERITATAVNTASHSAVCGEYPTGGAAGVSSNFLTASNLPVMQMKIKPQTFANNTGIRFFAGMWSGGIPAIATTIPGTAASTWGIYFTNCTATTPTCANTTLQGWVVNASTTLVGSVSCPTALSTSNFAYLRIEVRATNDIHFFEDANTTDGINEVECGSGVTGSANTGAMTPFVEAVNSNNATGATTVMDIDYLRTWQDDNVDPSTLDQGAGNTVTHPQTGMDPVTQSIAPISPDSPDPEIAGSFFNFNAATSDDTVFEHNVYIHGTLYADKIKANQIEGLSVFTDQLASLQQKMANDHASIGSSANPNGNSSNTLSIQTATTTLNLNDGLTVGGDANFHGNVFFYKLVTFSEKTFFNNDVTFSGHILTGGDTPTIAAGSSAGLTQAPVDNPGAALVDTSIDGNDSSGQINVVAGDNSASGEFAIISFKRPFAKTPQVFLTPTNGQSAQLRYYIAATKYGFKIIVLDAPAPGSSYSYNYWVAQ